MGNPDTVPTNVRKVDYDVYFQINVIWNKAYLPPDRCVGYLGRQKPGLAVPRTGLRWAGQHLNTIPRGGPGSGCATSGELAIFPTSQCPLEPPDTSQVPPGHAAGPTGSHTVASVDTHSGGENRSWAECLSQRAAECLCTQGQVHGRPLR